jgi:uncharacterized 2Fe-2S/4Fe-4S cluster protein (DUF4445 family)
MPTIRFLPDNLTIAAPAGSLLSDLIEQVGLHVNLPCGGQGRCGRCKVRVQSGDVRKRSISRLTEAELADGYALACQTLVEDTDLVIEIPPQDAMIVRRLPGEKRKLPELTLPENCDWQSDPALKRYYLDIDPPSLSDNTADADRVLRALRRRDGRLGDVTLNLPLLQRMADTLRGAEWRVTATIEFHDWTTGNGHRRPRLIGLAPGSTIDRLYGVAIDIGTTSNVVYLVDMFDGKVVDSAAEYNGQIACGEDVISRIIFARRPGGLAQLQKRVMDTLNGLIKRLAERNNVQINDISRAAVAGNTTMIHLFLAMNPEPIRLEPYIPTINTPMPVLAADLGLAINPDAKVDCLPGVGSYVGADITAGVLACQMHRHEALTLFIDVGTNGEMVLGNSDWLISCACSAGPAFEGAGVQCGMRATEGAIEEVWINRETAEPTYNTIGDLPARGLCGSGIISLLAELFVSGFLTKGGKLNNDINSPRIRPGEHGMEYVVAWNDETEDRTTDIVLNEVDIAGLIRTKAAIYAGFSTLTRSVGIRMSDIQRVLIGGAFGKYLNIEKAIQIGLLPDMPSDRFRYLGNTSVQGAFAALMCPGLRQEIGDVARMMTYLELSADNTFTEEFMSAMFLPHTDLSAFPSVEMALQTRQTPAETPAS